MGGAVVPADAECTGCHSTTTGTIGVTAIPLMAHPLEGWGRCADCHAPARLVDTAPGHSGIHATECLVCHKAGNLPAPLSRPHRDNQNVACLSCHGSTAPLPSDMTHRKETVCWLCHRLPTVEPPVPAHQTAPGEADCLTATRPAVVPERSRPITSSGPRTSACHATRLRSGRPEHAPADRRLARAVGYAGAASVTATDDLAVGRVVDPSSGRCRA